MVRLEWDPYKTQHITKKSLVKINNHININRNYEVQLTIKNWTMVQCSIAVSALSDCHNHNGHKIVFFTVPKRPEERVCRGKDGEYNNKKKIIKLCQNEDWMSSINHGCANGCVECSYNAIFRTWLHHFHPSIITCDSKDRHRLKIGAVPAMCLSKCAAENELHKENINLPRFVFLPEDLQHVHNYEM